MAPINTRISALEMSAQIMDDSRLTDLLKAFDDVKLNDDLSGDETPVDVEHLVSIVEKNPEWIFEEQVDLNDWVTPLNVIDAALTHLVKTNPGLILIGPVKRENQNTGGAEENVDEAAPKFAASLEQLKQVPESVVQSLCTILRFLSNLLRNCNTKSVFNSVDEVADLLAAANDTVAALALEVFASVATPPPLHRQQSPEGLQHTTALHTSTNETHKRLCALARGWGSRGTGLGLFDCVTADDSELGQGALPGDAGEIYFQYYGSLPSEKNESEAMEVDEKAGNDAQDTGGDGSCVLATIHLPASEIVEAPLYPGFGDSTSKKEVADTNKQKRRRTGSPDDDRARAMRTKSTAELFFLCLHKAGGRDRIPADRFFPLLADIRMARSFYSLDSRVSAVERRLNALVAILHAYPSQEIMSGYFQAQPELCVELIDLLRPTVASATVASGSSTSSPKGDVGDVQALSVLANPPQVPYRIRSLALEVLTALVARRDGASGGLTGVARQSNILNELGIGKGLYLGLLPTLIRFTLASLNAFLSRADTRGTMEQGAKGEMDDADSVAFSLGLAFVEATQPPSLSANVVLERALDFTDTVLTLTSAVVSAPSGTSALTESGLIPSLLESVKLESRMAKQGLPEGLGLSADDSLRIRAQLRFISAQAIQILEGAIVTHTNALSAFHDMQGVDVLISRFYNEVIHAKQAGQGKPEDQNSNDAVPMECDSPGNGDEQGAASDGAQGRKLSASRRVLLFSVVNCLSVVFHQEAATSTVSNPAGGAQLRKPELTLTLIEIFDNVSLYGGVLAALSASLLSDIMNNDPHVVKHVHSSGIAKAFFGMLKAEETAVFHGREMLSPVLPPVPELIMALPNVISALALTADGAKQVRAANPFSAVMSICHHPKYATPNSRCLLNEMTAIIGTGLDEIMRHVPLLRPLVISAIVSGMRATIGIGKDLLRREEKAASRSSADVSVMESERSCLMQYALNFGQMLEHILHSVDQSNSFVQAGGLDAIVDFFPCLMPTGFEFLANASCLSCPSVCTLAHTTCEESLRLAFKCIALHVESPKVIRKMTGALKGDLKNLGSMQHALKSTHRASRPKTSGLTAFGILDRFPDCQVYELKTKSKSSEKVSRLSRYLRSVATLQWHTDLLGIALKAACQRSQEAGSSGWNRQEREWKNELSSASFEELLGRISEFQQSAILESCRFRSQDDFEAAYKARLSPTPESTKNLRYKLRIVCQEGAVVRDGIEIDTCANVGSMEMGDIVVAFERCVNTSGVMRYRTRRGWVSELTRGHGREAISEVVDLFEEDSSELTGRSRFEDNSKERVDYAVASLPSVGASLLARFQNSYSDLFVSLSRVLAQSFGSLPVRSVSSSEGSIEAHVQKLLRTMTSTMNRGFNQEFVVQAMRQEEVTKAPKINQKGAALYLSALLSHFHSCIFEERRDRKMVNMPLLLYFFESDSSVEGLDCSSKHTAIDGVEDAEKQSAGVFVAISFVFSHALSDLTDLSSRDTPQGDAGTTAQKQVVGRSVAASIPPTVALLRQLSSASFIRSSPLTDVLSRLDSKELSRIFVGEESDGNMKKFNTDNFIKSLHFVVSNVVLDVWKDPRFILLPSHLLQPMASLAGEIVNGLEESISGARSDPEESAEGLFEHLSRVAASRSLRRGGAEQGEEVGAHDSFEPSEEAVTQMMEMGFSRDHALDALESTGSNHLEVAMEYALSHPPPSPATAERRRAERAERARQREASASASASASSRNDQGTEDSGVADAPAGDPAPGNDNAAHENADTDQSNRGGSSDSQQPNAGECGETGSTKEKESLAANETAEKLKSSLQTWIETSSTVSLDILCGGHVEPIEGVLDQSLARVTSQDNGQGVGDAESEALTVVVSSYLLGLCQRYKDKRDIIFSRLLARLKSQLAEVQTGSGTHVEVVEGKGVTFAALCHATVLFARAMPKSRVLILREGLVHCVVSCVQHTLSRRKAASQQCWPIWLAPCLLLVDVMGQPTAVFSEKAEEKTALDASETGATFLTGKDELNQVREEHATQVQMQAKTARQIFSSLGGATGTKTADETAGVQTSTPADDGAESAESTCLKDSKKPIGKDSSNGFAAIPAYFPLIPTQLSDECVQVCLDLIGTREQKDGGEHSFIPPGINHACLLLLVRLVRSQRASTRCLRSGAVEALLALPRSSRFIGASGLATILLRRLLEDESTLQTSMETEIRSILLKLHRKQNRSRQSTEKPSCSLSSFIQAATPLICRDSATFFKAAAVTVSMEPTSSSSSSRDKPVIVKILTSEERSRNTKAVAEALLVDLDSGSSSKKGTGSVGTKSSKGKSPHKRGSHPKRSKSKRGSVLNGTAANHVTVLLVNKVLSLASTIEEPRDDSLGEDSSFLWLAALLEILADLVLAFPACAAAIHRFRSKASSNPLSGMKNALPGCEAPPKTFVSFLLHELLPQDRWSFRRDTDLWDRRGKKDSKERQQKKKVVYVRTSIAQTTARLLVALVARVGEGRRRVISDLAFALSGGATSRVGDPSRKQDSFLETGTDCGHCALQGWGDLCIGLAAPRSNGANHENNSSLSFEVVKLMMEFGMSHSLVAALQHVQLEHPMATSTCTSLLIPLEVFSRASVTDTLQSIADKETADKEKAQNSDSGRAVEGSKSSRKKRAERVSLGPSQRSEGSFADDAMLEDGFDAETAARSARPQELDVQFDGSDDEHGDDEEDVVIDEMEMDNDEMDSDDIDESVDSDSSSDEVSEGSDQTSESSESDEIEGDDDVLSEDDESIQEDDAGDGDGGGWNSEAEGDFFEEGANPDMMNEPPMMFPGGPESDLEEGWTRIENAGLERMLFGTGARRLAQNQPSRSNGLLDAAEAMIGSLLRTGEFQPEALAQLEGSLGIRIGNARLDTVGERGESLGGVLGGRRGSTGPISSRTQRPREAWGTLPHVNQRNPPDVGYSALGGIGGRLPEITSIEYVYGGPSVASGSRNYDVFSAAAHEDPPEPYPSPSAVDSQLFPGGPAAATHARTQQALHPLLCGVDLPPVNSLVSDLLPHGERSTRRGQLNTRCPGESHVISSSYMVSSQGNLVRMSQGFGRSPLADLPLPPSSRQSNDGLVGWTDDGLPLDAAAGGFSAAVEQAFAETVSVPQDDAQQSRESVSRTTETAEPERSDPSDTAGTDAQETPQQQINESDTLRSQEDRGTENGGDIVSADVPNDDSVEQQQTGVESSSSSARVENSNPDGDGVASSLASGLRLSPGSGGSDAMSTGEVDGAPLPETESGSSSERPTENSTQQQETSTAMDSEVHNDEAESADNGQGPDDGNNNNNEEEEEEQSLPRHAPNENGLVCPPGMDLEVFNSLPPEMQQEVIGQHETSAEVAAQLDAASGLDPEVLAALPEDMRREAIAQERREREATLREQAPADPSHAEDMDNASFLVSLAPELREEILLTADDAFLNSLPPNIIAEAQILRERATLRHRRQQEEALLAAPQNRGTQPSSASGNNALSNATASRKRHRCGKLKVDCDRSQIVYLPQSGSTKDMGSPFGSSQLKTLIRLMFLLSPVRPQRLLQKVFQNLSANPSLRNTLSSVFTKLLHDDPVGSVAALAALDNPVSSNSDDFPPRSLIGAAPEVLDSGGLYPRMAMFRGRQGSSAAESIAASLPSSSRGLSREQHVPAVVLARIIDTLSYLGKSSPRVSLDVLSNGIIGDDSAGAGSCFEGILDLLNKPRYTQSSTNLEQLLALLETLASPLTALPKLGEDEHKLSQRDIDSAAASGKEWVDVPRVPVAQARLKLLCSILKMESCRDTAFTKVNVIVSRLCRVEGNRGYVLSELASVAQALGEDAVRELRALKIRMNDAVATKEASSDAEQKPSDSTGEPLLGSGSSSITLSNSSSEVKLLRILQTLQSLCVDNSHDEQAGKHENSFVTRELVQILQRINLTDLWEQLSRCLKSVKVLEGISSTEEVDEKDEDAEEGNDDGAEGDNNDSGVAGGKKLKNSAAGLLTRFLPSIEAFFVVNASTTRPEGDSETKSSNVESDTKVGSADQAGTGAADAESELKSLVGGKQVFDFVGDNRVLLNALIRNSPGLLDKGLRAMVQVSHFRGFLDFDVKRQWFKSQIRRLRQLASRRHGSLRLSVRRENVFEETFHQLRLRNADEMRSRLHITFRGEEGVDAGGLSREFFGILAKEMFNPNYALFTSTEDGCTFQPNPNSSINPDHLSYFRFVGRIVGKAVADGFLLDAHFTRSLYKHMLGIKPTHHDMEAIDPDYYKNLKMILEYSLADIGLDLTFSIEDHSFGRSQIIDLVENGRNIAVTDETKAKYVSLVCQHRMTTAISSQIKAYLDGFYELVSRDLIAIFTPRELELLISGLPDIDVLDLKQNTDYNGYKATDPEIEWFWNVMVSLSRSQKAAFLQFVTGSSKVPLGGFSQLQGMRGVQKFSIHKIGGTSGALMSAHTCFNSLDLPVYTSQEELREKLLYAISEGQGSFMFA